MKSKLIIGVLLSSVVTAGFASTTVNLTPTSETLGSASIPLNSLPKGNYQVGCYLAFYINSEAPQLAVISVKLGSNSANFSITEGNSSESYKGIGYITGNYGGQFTIGPVSSQDGSISIKNFGPYPLAFGSPGYCTATPIS